MSTEQEPIKVEGEAVSESEAKAAGEAEGTAPSGPPIHGFEREPWYPLTANAQDEAAGTGLHLASCSSCQFAGRHFGAEGQAERIECRRDAPAPAVRVDRADPGTARPVWPEVRSGDWCGHFWPAVDLDARLKAYRARCVASK